MDCFFQKLPPELHLLILETFTTRRDLMSLVLAYKAMHELYQNNRWIILRLLLDHYLRLVTRSDAVAAFRSRKLSITRGANQENIDILLDQRRKGHCEKPEIGDEVIGLLQLHEKAEWLLAEFEKTMPCPKWLSEPDWQAHLPLTLTDDERRRFFRGFYRLEIWCNIWGEADYCNHGRFPMSDGFTAMMDHFFLTMPPWEMEEIACVWWILSERVMHKMPFGFDFINGGRAPETVKDFTSLVCKGPGVVYGLSRLQGRAMADFVSRNYVSYIRADNCIFTHNNPFHIFKRDDVAKDHHFQYPASQWNNLDHEQYLQMANGLSTEKQPGPCWEWMQIGLYDYNDFVFEAFTWGFQTAALLWAHALWDSKRLNEWKIPL